MSALHGEAKMFIFKPYRKPEGLNMASTSLPRLRRVAAGAALLLTALGGGALAGTNPLEDFNSGPLTDSFRTTYSNVGDATVNVDVPYGLDGAQKYDVYLPASTSNAPIIVMIHGGAWTGGDKQANDVAEAKAGYFVSKGYIFVSLNYRLLPQSDRSSLPRASPSGAGTMPYLESEEPLTRVSMANSPTPRPASI